MNPGLLGKEGAAEVAAGLLAGSEELLFQSQMQLSISQDGYVHYGDKVMLVNPDHPETEADLFLGGNLSLCVTPDEVKAHLSDELEVPCGLSLAQVTVPIGRNTFIVLR